MFLSAIASSSHANDSGTLFTYKAAAVQQEMSGLTKLETYVEQHPGLTYNDLVDQHSDLLDGVRYDVEASLGVMKPVDGPLGIPSFLWGCVLGWVGILVVYLITNDSEEAKKAFWGCLLQPVAACAVYLIFIGVMSAVYGFY
jgi:hypothetical protein